MGVRRVLVLSFFCALTFIVNAQPNPSGYDAKWKLIDSLILKKGMTQSALDEVHKLVVVARREKNDPQLIKGLVYRLRLEQTRTDSGILFAINDLEHELSTDNDRQPARSILQSILAGLYYDYLRTNFYQLSSRSNTVNFEKKDVATWSINDLKRKITGLYLGSLTGEQQLWQTPTTDYSPIVVRGNASALRPTLLDLLGHAALDYFKIIDAMNDQQRKDSLSGQSQARLLLQRLLRRHQADKTPDALIDLQIEQAVFEYQYGSSEKKDQRYLRELVRITDQYGSHPSSAEAWYLQAQYYAGHSGVAANQQDSLGNQKAVTICERVLASKDSSEGRGHCERLLYDLQRKTINLTTEKVNIPNLPFRVLVQWRNFSRLYLRLIAYDPADESQNYVHDTVFWKKALQTPVIRAWTQDLPDTKDYRSHEVEIAVGSLPPGNYALLASTDEGWGFKSSVMCLQGFAVSRISWINQGDDFFVLDRQSGQPLAGAGVRIWDRPNTGNGKRLVKGEAFTSDARGYFHLPRKKDLSAGPTLLEVTIAGDHYFPRDLVFGNYYPETGNAAPEERRDYEVRHAQGYLFTDRAIYRPGQTVYFKGIQVTKDYDSHTNKLMTDAAVKLYLFNSNQQKIDSFDGKTNAFGSYHGAFRLPEHQLNGSFSIQQEDIGTAVSFSVEEYKRPKFFVDYDKMAGSYRVGDSIRVTGFAKAYAGNGIDGATVVYRITRRAHFHYLWLFSRRIMPVSMAEIGHGQLQTDAEGKFTIPFFAVPDEQVSPDTKPEYDYEVTADVTDVNGETRSGRTTIVAGYTVMRLELKVPLEGQLPADSAVRIAVGATNLSGEPVGADVGLTLYPLQAPQRLIRARLWSPPDRFVLSRNTFLDSFPHDEYREETNKETWEKEKAVWEKRSSVADSGKPELTIPGGTLAPGWYLLEASTVDNYGQPVVDKQYIQLYDGKTGRPGNPQYVWPAKQSVTAEPGQKVTTTMGSSDADLFVIRTMEHPAEKTYQPFALSKERKSYEWTIADSDRGGFGVLDAFVRDNRIYQHSTTVSVPWSNKQLDIHYASYRDKTQPGSTEKWQVKITGTNGEKASAEVLAAMYDASLDAFRGHRWQTPTLYPVFGGASEWPGYAMFTPVRSLGREFGARRPGFYSKVYDRLLQPQRAGPLLYRNALSAPSEMYAHADLLKAMPSAAMDKRGLVSGRLAEDEVVASAPPPAPPPVQARKDFRETAFFFPELHTDSAGNVSFTFTMPEALTSWKWMTLAHTRDLAFGYSERSIITQKQLMVQPNAPRFLREGDRMELPVKVVNLTDSELTGQMYLQLTDPTTGETADGWFTNRQANQYFTVPAHQSVSVGFPLDVPYQYNRPLTYKVTAEARNYSDGEEATLPVVSNRMLVTESLPLNMPGDGTKHFSFDKLLKSGSSETLNHHALTVEFTANPAWYAVQALPYLMEYPYECTEQTFNRAYANALATKIVTGTPRLRQVFEKWRSDTAALLSNLQKNSGLKSVLLEETPWVLQGKSEEQQKKNIALLFDLDRMSRELESAIDRLSRLQSQDGGFPWFEGGTDDRYITQYILTGIGRLQRLKALPASTETKIKMVLSAALPWLDAQVRMDYEKELAAEKLRAKGGARPLTAGVISRLTIQYLYMRSFFNESGIPGDILPAVSYYRKQCQNTWVQEGKYMQGMIALALFRTGDIRTAKDIIASLKQTAIRDEEKGMYWKGMETGYFWYQAPVETQSLLVEAFREIAPDAVVDRQLKTWLLRQKQTHNWPTTKATADACYALMIGGQNWLNAERNVAITLGDKKIDWPANASGEAGTGYNKKVFDAPFVNPSMGNITVTMKTAGATPAAAGANPARGATPTNGPAPTGSSPAWGAVYWQYFDMLDRITPPAPGKAALRIEKKLFLSRNTDRGPVLEPIVDNGSLKPGDKVVVRIVITADRSLEYVHMKDMRGACFEPVNVISSYKWQDGLGYYESTRDASTDFFFSWLPKGTHVFEYTLFTGQAGNFSNGLTSIECMYAPEFSFHSEGIRVNVEAAP
ncbi:alpha-2-macroglobulin family protein [Puia sp.]|uniref:alpha-2-macroglobulin family protein n=1 Tax=Puia sp. TaxID=2045100 RepID=UPI002F3F8D85